MSRGRSPTTGTAGGLHHERESFRSGWPKARELLDSRVYHGEMPENDVELLAKWYAIRGFLLGGGEKDEFNNMVKEFNTQLPDDISGQMANAIKLITGYMSENHSS